MFVWNIGLEEKYGVRSKNHTYFLFNLLIAKGEEKVIWFAAANEDGLGWHMGKAVDDNDLKTLD